MAKDFALIKRAESGIYTPTLTNVTNLDGSTSDVAMYHKIGDIVQVFGRVVVDPTAAALTELGISLPFPSNLAGTEDLSGLIISSPDPVVGVVVADTTNNRAEASFTTANGTQRAYRYSFSYRIL